MITVRLIRWVERHRIVGNVIFCLVAMLVVVGAIRLATGL